MHLLCVDNVRAHCVLYQNSCHTLVPLKALFASGTLGPDLDVCYESSSDTSHDAFVDQKLKILVIINLIQTETLPQYFITNPGHLVLPLTAFES